MDAFSGPSGLPPFQRSFRMADGVELVGDVWGTPDLPPALLLHGGGQTRYAWKRTAAVLADHGYCAIAVDQRGHGDSDWSADGAYEIDHFANDVRQLAAGLHAKPVLIGASLGGMASLIAAGEADISLAAALVLVDITPRIEPAGVERVRKFMAAHIDDGFATLEEASEAIAAYLPHRPRPKNLDGLNRNLKLGKDGRYRWHYDPAFVRGMPARADADREARLTAAVQRLRIPVLLVRGGSSELVSEDIAREFVGLVPNARYADVHGAAHMVAGDVNDPFTEAVVAFLDDLSNP